MGRWAWRRGAAVTRREKAKLISGGTKSYNKQVGNRLFLDGTKKREKERQEERKRGS